MSVQISSSARTDCSFVPDLHAPIFQVRLLISDQRSPQLIHAGFGAALACNVYFGDLLVYRLNLFREFNDPCGLLS